MPSTPDKYATLAPFLSVRDGARAIDFYKAAFGAKELFRMDDGSGSVVRVLALRRVA
jgi:PhnB protein